MRPHRLAVALCGLGALFLPHRPLDAQPGSRNVRLRYTFQPDCFRPSLTAACDRRKANGKLDLGPQIAVWVEGADRRFVADLMVTNAVALRGIGNRPGNWRLPSSPKFPYGKRPMALPIWAHARGKQYDVVVMQDGGPDREFWLGFHEAISTPDPFFCRPMSNAEIDLDAVTCPTTVFNSAKGRYNRNEKTYYPPRNDLRMFSDRDCDEPNGRITTCAMSARTFADLNDLDAVAAATPSYGRPFTGTWVVPADLPDGDYALMLEISKEFDLNSTYTGTGKYEAFTDPNLVDSGLKNNFGQPSVVFRVPFKLSRRAPFQGGTSEIAGYGDWTGASGALSPPDSTISDAPGSGKGRLLAIAQPSVAGGAPITARLHVVTEVPEVPVDPPDGGAPPPDGEAPGSPDGGVPADGGGGSGCPADPQPSLAVTVPPMTLKPESAEAVFTEPAGPWHRMIEQYQVRVWEGDEQSPRAFDAGIPAEPLSPSTPGQARTAVLPNLKPDTRYTVGVKAVGPCLGGISYAPIKTPVRKFTQLSGCFIATAAYGTAQAPGVEALRAVRDRARRESGFAATAAALYERSSPPLADALRGSGEGRAVVRQALAPLMEVASALQALLPAK